MGSRKEESSESTADGNQQNDADDSSVPHVDNYDVPEHFERSKIVLKSMYI